MAFDLLGDGQSRKGSKMRSGSKRGSKDSRGSDYDDSHEDEEDRKAARKASKKASEAAQLAGLEEQAKSLAGDGSPELVSRLLQNRRANLQLGEQIKQYDKMLKKLLTEGHFDMAELDKVQGMKGKQKETQALAEEVAETRKAIRLVQRQLRKKRNVWSTMDAPMLVKKHNAPSDTQGPLEINNKRQSDTRANALRRASTMRASTAMFRTEDNHPIFEEGGELMVGRQNSIQEGGFLTVRGAGGSVLGLDQQGDSRYSTGWITTLVRVSTMITTDECSQWPRPNNLTSVSLVVQVVAMGTNINSMRAPRARWGSSTKCGRPWACRSTGSTLPGLRYSAAIRGIRGCYSNRL